ncbi:hypothetical protein I79_014895 [Cricetulus griseus]|uniref:Uncharacterized protein n=1 Tax=Cricetulus griseus TaxID=10029 RepID=G3HVB4_CRIGR|nr:hypothetical protein I79_014895 [Cricetulus griseus]
MTIRAILITGSVIASHVTITPVSSPPPLTISSLPTVTITTSVTAAINSVIITHVITTIGVVTITDSSITAMVTNMTHLHLCHHQYRCHPRAATTTFNVTTVATSVN